MNANTRRIFSPTEAEGIRVEYESGGTTLRELAKKHNCSSSTVWRVVNKAESYDPGPAERVLEMVDQAEDFILWARDQLDDLLAEIDDLRGVL